jgi:DNA-binding NarL/FixJ family response regulator
MESDPMHVFLIGSKPEVRDKIKNALSELKEFQYSGWSFGGSEGVKQIEIAKPEFVLIDISVDMNSIDLVRLVKNANASTKIIVICTSFDPNWIDKWMEAGADNFLGKPINEKDLQTVLEVTSR